VPFSLDEDLKASVHAGDLNQLFIRRFPDKPTTGPDFVYWAAAHALAHIPSGYSSVLEALGVLGISAPLTPCRGLTPEHSGTLTDACTQLGLEVGYETDDKGAIFSALLRRARTEDRGMENEPTLSARRILAFGKSIFMDDACRQLRVLSETMPTDRSVLRGALSTKFLNPSLPISDRKAYFSTWIIDISDRAGTTHGCGGYLPNENSAVVGGCSWATIDKHSIAIDVRVGDTTSETPLIVKVADESDKTPTTVEACGVDYAESLITFELRRFMRKYG
jgi:hypothetical protein